MADVAGKFVKQFVRGMRKHGQYRGDGFLSVTPGGLAITGKHVYSLGQRWLFGLALAIGVLVLTFGMFAPGLLLIYPVVEYVWLRKGDQVVPYSRIEAYNAVPEKNLIAIQFHGTPWEAPVVMRTPDWREIYDALYSHVSHARVT